MTFEQMMSRWSDEDLHRFANEELSRMCSSPKEHLHRCIPPNHRDTDMVFMEVLRRWELCRSGADATVDTIAERT